MPFSLKTLLGSSIDGTIKEIGKILDNLITTKAEKAEAKLQIEKLLLDSNAKLDSEITERLKIDMQSDNWLSKNIRPLMLVATFGILMIMTLFDGNVGTFSINTEYIELYKAAFLLEIAFYFGSRALTITQKIRNNK